MATVPLMMAHFSSPPHMPTLLEGSFVYTNPTSIPNGNPFWA
jgi:hypothetical protein